MGSWFCVRGGLFFLVSKVENKIFSGERLIKIVCLFNSNNFKKVLFEILTFRGRRLHQHTRNKAFPPPL